MASREVVVGLLEQFGPLTYGALLELAYQRQGHARIGRTVNTLVREGTIVRGTSKRRRHILCALSQRSLALIPEPPALPPALPPSGYQAGYNTVVGAAYAQ